VINLVNVLAKIEKKPGKFYFVDKEGQVIEATPKEMRDKRKPKKRK